MFDWTGFLSTIGALGGAGAALILPLFRAQSRRIKSLEEAADKKQEEYVGVIRQLTVLFEGKQACEKREQEQAKELKALRRRVKLLDGKSHKDDAEEGS